MEIIGGFSLRGSLPAAFSVSKAAFDNFDAFQRAPIGNGSFEMDGTWEDGQYIRVKRFVGGVR